MKHVDHVKTVFREGRKSWFCPLIYVHPSLLQIVGTFLAYIIICMQFAQSDSNPEVKCNCCPDQGHVSLDLKTNLSSLNMSNIISVDNMFQNLRFLPEYVSYVVHSDILN